MQVVEVYLHPFWAQFTLEMCAAAENCEKTLKFLIV